MNIPPTPPASLKTTTLLLIPTTKTFKSNPSSSSAPKHQNQNTPLQHRQAKQIIVAAPPSDKPPYKPACPDPSVEAEIKEFLHHSSYPYLELILNFRNIDQQTFEDNVLPYCITKLFVHQSHKKPYFKACSVPMIWALDGSHPENHELIVSIVDWFLYLASDSLDKAEAIYSTHAMLCVLCQKLSAFDLLERHEFINAVCYVFSHDRQQARFLIKEKLLSASPDESKFLSRILDQISIKNKAVSFNQPV